MEPTFAQLTAQYPSPSAKQQSGLYLVELPDGVTYIDGKSMSPSTIHGGPLQWCE